MMQGNSQPVVKLLPSLADFAFLMPIAMLFTRMEGTRVLLGDGDTGWHIRTGEWILANGRVPFQDIFSFTRPGQPWFAWEWLWDVVFAMVFRSGGLALVVLINAVLIAGLSLALYRMLCKFGTPLVALAVTLSAMTASSIHFLARPHLFTLVFTLAFIWILERTHQGRERLLWWLPALMVLWANTHGGFIVGVILIGAYAAGQMITAMLAGEAADRAAAWLRARRYLGVAGACLAASLVNPYFYRLHVHIARYLASSYEKEHVAEFLSLNFHHPVAPFFELLLFAGACSVVWHVRRGNYHVALLVVVWAHGALLSVRNMPLYAIISAPFIVSAVDAGLRQLPELRVAVWLRRAGSALRNTADGVAEMEAVGRWHLLSAGAVAAVALLLHAPAPPKAFRPYYDPGSYPAAALKALKFGPNSRIFSNDEWGDYLIFSLWDRRTKVFVDGRSDFYGVAFEEKKYIDTFNMKAGWEKTLSQYGVDTILLPASACMAGALKESQRWRLVYDDGIALAFQPADRLLTAGTQVSTPSRGGIGRDREITKTVARDRTITKSDRSLNN